ncbi:MAG: DNRLRE domain-containing protein, partial [Anaerolineae bacterium]|nr:DNRLRE domain-containing protein [Anaerolineae bacterium]
MKNVDAGSIVAYGIYWNNGNDFENCNVDSSNLLGADPLLDVQFHLQQASPALDAGTAFFAWQGETVLDRPFTSYNGMAPDLGAFEFDGDPTPSLAIDDITVTECNSGTVNATFTVTLSSASAHTVTVDYATADGTATAPQDYSAVALSTLSFPPGATAQTITVVVNGDVIDEPNEVFFVNLSNAVNATIGDNQGVGTIVNDDSPGPVTVSFQDGVNGYNSTRDTKLLSDTPGTNYGSATTLSVDGSPDESALLYWNVTSIPVGSTVQSVNITVNVTNTSGASYEIYELQRPWVEGEATWNEHASGQSWEVAGAGRPGDRGSTVLGVIIGSSPGLNTISFNSAGIAVVQSWVDHPSSNYGFIVQDYINHTNRLNFSSREAGTVSNRPKLTVSYSGEGQAAQVLRKVRGPYLQIGTPASLVVRWRTNLASDSRVRYGTDPNDLSLVFDDLAVTTEHELTISGLAPNTKYYYSVGSTGDTLAIGPDYFFFSAPRTKMPKKSRLWVLGDAGTAKSKQRAVRDAYYAFTDTNRTDLWVMLGDNAYIDGTNDEYQAAVFDMYPDMLRKSVLWPAFGNHDGHSASSLTQTGPFYEIFSLPAKGEAGGMASGTEAYYSFEYANIHFICLNSHDMPREQDGAMLAWLQNDLSANTMDWTIAFWHHPPYSKGFHDSDSEPKPIQMRVNALPILEEGGVDLVLTGHSHSYERSFLLDGHYGHSSTLTDSMIIDGGNGRTDGDGAYHKSTLGPASHKGAIYVVAGSSGMTSGGSLNHPAMYISLNVLGSVVLDVDGNRIDLTFLDHTGTKRDYFTLVKGAVDARIPVELSAFTASVIELKQNYPNPFNPTTKISYSMPNSGFVALKIHDTLGGEVQTLVSEFQKAGTYSLDFDASN